MTNVLKNALLVALLLFLNLYFTNVNVFLFRALPFLRFVVRTFCFRIRRLLFSNFLLVNDGANSLRYAFRVRGNRLLRNFIMDLLDA